jgi:hypothetical protein
MPWGELKTHKDIANCKNIFTIKDFCDGLHNTEYSPIANVLLYFFGIVRDRNRCFTIFDYEILISEFYQVLSALGTSNDKMYDWCDMQDSQKTV